MKPSRVLRRVSASAAGALVAMMLAGAAASGTESTAGPRLVRDLRTGVEVNDPVTSLEVFQMTGLGSLAVFSVFSNDEIDCGLWATDGTPVGTRRLADLCATAPEDPSALGDGGLLAVAGGLAYAVDSDRRLWRTDGTRRGTFPLGGEMRLDPFSRPPSPADDGRRLYFSGCTAEEGCELWSTDGSIAGTHQLGDLIPGPEGSHPGVFSRAGSRVFFIAADPGGFQAALWETDGLPAGTRRLTAISHVAAIRALPTAVLLISPGCFREFCPSQLKVFDRRTGQTSALISAPVGLVNLQLFGDTAWIMAYKEEGGRLFVWRSDGSVRGTVEVPLPAGFRSNFAVLRPTAGGAVISGRVGDYGVEDLWVLRGSPPRAIPLSGCPGGCPRLLPYGFESVVLGDHLVFAGLDADHGVEPWVTDGTGAGTRLLGDTCEGPCGGAQFRFQALLGRALWVDAEGALWASDGTPRGTRRVAPVTQPLDQGFRRLEAAVLGDRLVFPGYDSQHGPQPWVSDFTARGTRPAALLGNLAASSWIFAPTALGDRVVFAACDDTGAEIWASDGTTAGTVALTSSPESCELRPMVRTVAAAGLVFFEWQRQLWRTDGTPAGTFPVASTFPLVLDAVALGGRLLFLLYPDPSDPAAGSPVWASDGTVAGTGPLFNLPFTGGPFSMSVAGEAAYFVTQVPDSTYPSTVFRTDGTAAGSFPLLALAEQTFGLRVLQLGAEAFFLAHGAGTPETELWRTDGSASGTHPVIPSGAASRPHAPVFLGPCPGALCFFAHARPHPDSPLTLWRTDGTAEGTRPLHEIGPPIGAYEPLNPQFTAVGDLTFFRGEDPEHGTELWRTDGTIDGTYRLTDLVPGPGHARIREMAAHAGRLYFAATNGRTGAELWTSDGTAEGTTLVEDLAPGPVSSSPALFASTGSGLFFTADDGQTGRELWLLPATAASEPCAPDPQTLCLAGGRLRATAAWHDRGTWIPGAATDLGSLAGTFSFHRLPAPGGEPDVAFRLVPTFSAEPGAVFVGGLSNLEYALTFTDLETGLTRRYVNVAGNLGSLFDRVGLRPSAGLPSSELRLPASTSAAKLSAALLPDTAGPEGTGCVEGPRRLCLLGGRYAVEASWWAGAAGPQAAGGRALTERSGAFFLPDPLRPAMIVKLVDGSEVNGRLWIFAATLTTEPLTLTVTDTALGQVRTYVFPAGAPASIADTEAM